MIGDWKTWLVGFLFLFSATAEGLQEGVSSVEDGPIHEAYLTRVQGAIILDGVPTEPPQTLNERIPSKVDGLVQWISGYWSWSQKKGDFIWISGVWRSPPPGHQWISGFWKQYGEYWTWIPGFWSAIDLSEIRYIQKTPREPLDEELGSSPGDEYFWMNGYWAYSDQDDDFAWVNGAWEKLDPHWVLVPTHYTWRPEGYVLIPAYWDWPLKERGQAYGAVEIDPYYRRTIIYEPIILIELDVLIQSLFPWYPDYLCYFHHHWHFWPNWWYGCNCVPAWWWWGDWWTLSWQNQWDLWWWWSHPGFPHPFWMNAHFSAMMHPPQEHLLNWMKGIIPPAMISKNGLIPVNELLEKIKEVTGEDGPILPLDPKVREEIIDSILPGFVADPLRPTGDEIEKDDVAKPSIDKETLEDLPRRLTPVIPPKPRRLDELRPPIRPIHPTRPVRPEPPPRHRRPSSPPEENPRWRMPHPPRRVYPERPPRRDQPSQWRRPHVRPRPETTPWTTPEDFRKPPRPSETRSYPPSETEPTPPPTRRRPRSRYQPERFPQSTPIYPGRVFQPSEIQPQRRGRLRQSQPQQRTYPIAPEHKERRVRPYETPTSPGEPF